MGVRFCLRAKCVYLSTGVSKPGAGEEQEEERRRGAAEKRRGEEEERRRGGEEEGSGTKAKAHYIDLNPNPKTLNPKDQGQIQSRQSEL